MHAPHRMHLSLDALDIFTHLGGRLVSSRVVLLQRFGDDGVQSARDRRVQIMRWGWRLIENRVVDDCRRLAREGTLASRHLVQDQPEGEQVRAGV